MLTIHVQPLDDNFQLHLIGHVAQGAHGRAQLLLGDEAIAIAVKDFEGLTDLCGGSRAGWDLASVPNTPSLSHRHPQTCSLSPALRIHQGACRSCQRQVAGGGPSVHHSTAFLELRAGRVRRQRYAQACSTARITLGMGGGGVLLLPARLPQPPRACSRRPRVAGKHESRPQSGLLGPGCSGHSVRGQRLPCPPLIPSITHSPSSLSHASSPGLGLETPASTP